ncbi:MAG: SMP-30/gluconolactonase/LRE family protein [Rhodobacteraceae bacterium]|nr:SMP-30/gluconolactonase/LRE family protein [Paracoccaceae bacterium]
MTGEHAAAAPFVPLSDFRAKLGESPVWSAKHNAIWWVDIAGRKLLRTDLSGVSQTWPTPEIPGFVQVIGGDVLVGMQSGIFQFTPSTATFEKHVSLPAHGQRFNDACTDAQGRIWAGTMDLENKRPNGTLYLYDPAQRTLEPQFVGFRTINGLAWDAANNRLFFSDSHPSVQTVWTSHPESSANKTVFARFDGLAGRPDGATLDTGGRYWIAGVGGAVLYRFAPDGQTFAQYSVPVASPTKPAFIGRAMVLTSFIDKVDGGRLAIWDKPPQESIAL